MYKATITGTLAILAVALLVSGRVEAGSSASAPSKFGHNSQVASVRQAQTKGHAQGTDFAISEFSSSSARTHGAKFR
jgi:hypothetical protein